MDLTEGENAHLGDGHSDTPGPNARNLCRRRSAFCSLVNAAGLTHSPGPAAEAASKERPGPFPSPLPPGEGLLADDRRQLRPRPEGTRGPWGNAQGRQNQRTRLQPPLRPCPGAWGHTSTHLTAEGSRTAFSPTSGEVQGQGVGRWCPWRLRGGAGQLWPLSCSRRPREGRSALGVQGHPCHLHLSAQASLRPPVQPTWFSQEALTLRPSLSYTCSDTVPQEATLSSSG